MNSVHSSNGSQGLGENRCFFCLFVAFLFIFSQFWQNLPFFWLRFVTVFFSEKFDSIRPPRNVCTPNIKFNPQFPASSAVLLKPSISIMSPPHVTAQSSWVALPACWGLLMWVPFGYGGLLRLATTNHPHSAAQGGGNVQQMCRKCSSLNSHFYPYFWDNAAVSLCQRKHPVLLTHQPTTRFCNGISWSRFFYYWCAALLPPGIIFLIPGISKFSGILKAFWDILRHFKAQLSGWSKRRTNVFE